jgi:hypothetical protein
LSVLKPMWSIVGTTEHRPTFSCPPC